MHAQLLCLGYGYTARAVAAQASAYFSDCTIVGTTRQNFENAHALFENATHVLISIPPVETSEGKPLDAVLGHYQSALLQAKHLQWVGVLSTTGVYGDAAGGWVDETSPLKPQSPREMRRLWSEQQWMALSSLPVHIFRLSAIYGPGRSALDALSQGTARCIDKPGQWFSRMHVEDIAQALLRSMQHPTSGEIYNLADDKPSAPWEPIHFAAKLLDIPPPPLIPYAQADLSPMAREFYQASRRVRNDKVKRELGVVLRYPGYEEGLRAIVGGVYTQAT